MHDYWNLEKVPSCTLIPPCTFIRQVRELVNRRETIEKQKPETENNKNEKTNMFLALVLIHTGQNEKHFDFLRTTQNSNGVWK